MKKQFKIPSDLSMVQKISAQVLQLLTGQFSVSETFSFDLRLCLEEALINAMKHGNKLRKDTFVTLDVDADADRVSLVVRDQGAGFSMQNIADCTKEENLFKNCGRGVYLIKHLMDEVRYNDVGNELTMTKRLNKSVVH